MQNLEFVVTRLEKIAAKLTTIKQNQKTMNDSIYHEPVENSDKIGAHDLQMKKNGFLADINYLLSDIENSLEAQESLQSELRGIIFSPIQKESCNTHG